ncbi:two-partner secretion domain-containing protein [Methylobacillus glycogenes]|uniref:two-partner secretion domain-containing protein n=1 Tax=Methylobacillus glycogenes TaxID=406 RepID=UPI00046F66B7|nr:filamentous hemagglutinin N-terminal domain-containing protein [Methylobacillus glycogenes]
MNKGVFRLVFNKRLGAYVPAHELAHATSSAGRSQRARKRLLAAMLAAMVPAVAPGMVLADPGLVPFASSGLIPGSSPWSNASITGVTPTITTIQQTAPQAIANWAQFNLAREHTLNINQQANWQMLHRISDLNPSVIAGTINAAGTNYFVNTNGIIFANGAQINVGSLMAVTSNSMDDAMFTRGLLSNLGQLPVFSNTGGFIKVEAGANINAATGGRVMLLAKDVENHA